MPEIYISLQKFTNQVTQIQQSEARFAESALQTSLETSSRGPGDNYQAKNHLLKQYPHIGYPPR